MQRLYGDHKNRSTSSSLKDQKEYFELQDNNNGPNPFTAKREAMVGRSSVPSAAAAPSNSSYVIPSSTDIMTRSEPKYTYEQPLPSRSFTPNPAASSTSHLNDFTSATTIHCITIADHVMNCPICSKFYRDYSPFYKVVSLICIAVLIGVLWSGYHKNNKCSHVVHSSPHPPTL